MKLLRLSKTLWAIERGDDILYGTQLEAVKLMKKLGVPGNEIQFGFSEIINNDHNLAVYGLFNKAFLYSRFSDELDNLLPIQGAA